MRFEIDDGTTWPVDASSPVLTDRELDRLSGHHPPSVTTYAHIKEWNTRAAARTSKFLAGGWSRRRRSDHVVRGPMIFEDVLFESQTTTAPQPSSSRTLVLAHGSAHAHQLHDQVQQRLPHLIDFGTSNSAGRLRLVGALFRLCRKLPHRQILQLHFRGVGQQGADGGCRMVGFVTGSRAFATGRL